MKAARYYGNHDIRIETIPDPPPPEPEEVSQLARYPRFLEIQAVTFPVAA